MKLGFIIPNYPGEKRVALLPEHIDKFKDEIIIEKDFGKNLNISDEEYQNKGCIISTRKKIFLECDAIFSLKLIQPNDYELLEENKIIVGWTHPTGSGKEFMAIAKEKKIKIIDIDNIYPSLYVGDEVIPIKTLKKNFIRKNSELAGISSCYHALISHGFLPDSNTKVAILSIGNVSQGCIQLFSKFNSEIRVFTRSNMDELKSSLYKYDIIVNGIEINGSENHILTLKDQEKLKKGCLVIDAAADAGGAIEGTVFTDMSKPIYEKNGKYYYVVNNAPSVFFRKASFEISKSISKNILKKGIELLLKGDKI